MMAAYDALAMLRPLVSVRAVEHIRLLLTIKHFVKCKTLHLTY